MQLSCAIGVEKPLTLFVETCGMSEYLTASGITNVINVAFDCRPGAIAVSSSLRVPEYQGNAAFCHFGRVPLRSSIGECQDLTK